MEIKFDPYQPPAVRFDSLVIGNTFFYNKYNYIKTSNREAVDLSNGLSQCFRVDAPVNQTVLTAKAAWKW
jgi:hypothetical protein